MSQFIEWHKQTISPLMEGVYKRQALVGCCDLFEAELRVINRQTTGRCFGASKPTLFLRFAKLLAKESLSHIVVVTRYLWTFKYVM